MMYIWMLFRKIFIILMVLLVVTGCSTNGNTKNRTANSSKVPTEELQVNKKPSKSVDMFEDKDTKKVLSQTKILKEDIIQNEEATVEEIKSFLIGDDEDQFNKIRTTLANNIPYRINFFEDESFEG